MVEPVTTTAVLGVAATVVTVATTAVKVITTVFGWLLTVLKLIFAFIVRWTYYTIMLPIVLVEGLLASPLYDTDVLLQDLKRNTFDKNPPRRLAEADFVGIETLIVTIQTEIQTIVTDLVTFYSPLLMGFPFFFVLGFFVFFMALIGYVITPFVFVWAQLVYSGTILGLNLTAIWLNANFVAWSVIAPFWNTFVRFLFAALQALFRIFCPGGDPFQMDPATACPIFTGLIGFIQTSWPTLLAAAQLAWTQLGIMYSTLGTTICTNDLCPTYLCTKYMNTSTCYWGSEFAIHFSLGLALDAFTIYVWAGLLLLVYAMDIISEFVLNLGFLMRNVPFLAPHIAAIKATLVVNQLETMYVPETMIIARTLLVLSKSILHYVLVAISSLVIALMAFLDSLLCHVLIEPYQCLGAKICYLLVYDFSIPFGFSIGGIFYGFTINVPLRTLICTNTLHIVPGQCANSGCDACAYRPLGIPISPHPLFSQSFAVHGLENYIYVPCTFNGCCRTSHSLIQNVIQ
jgi:hypothetical protein